jgi:hypothetical protein
VALACVPLPVDTVGRDCSYHAPLVAPIPPLVEMILVQAIESA